MSHTEARVLSYLLNAAWQTPLVFAAAWLAARTLRRSDAALEHRIWAVALVLEAVLPACSLRPDRVLRWLMLPFAAGRPSAATVTVTMGAGFAQPGLSLPPWLLEAILPLYACIVLYFTARLAISLYRTTRLRSEAQPLVLDGAAQTSFKRLSASFGMRHVAVAVSPRVFGPVIVGVRHPTLLLPGTMLSELAPEDFEAALAHELAHVQRRDFLKNLLYELLLLPVSFHPLAWITRARVAASREALCDALAAEAVRGRQRYARSLLRLASTFAERTRSSNLHAIGIFDANRFENFERRVMTLTNKTVEVRAARRVAVAAVTVMLGLATCASALALRVRVAEPASAPMHTTAAQDEQARHVSGGVMAGNILSKVNPVYPQEAKDKKIGGTVVLEAVIGKDGSIERLKALSGPDVLVSSALEAVKQWVYKPYLLNGQPTEVQTTITVTYTLNNQ